jgi:hypothetical protein
MKLLQYENCDIPDENIHRYTFIVNELHMLMCNDSTIHNNFMTHIYQESVNWILKRAMLRYKVHLTHHFSVLVTNDHLLCVLSYVDQQSWIEFPGHTPYHMLLHLHQIGMNNLYQLWYNIPQLNDKFRGMNNNNNPAFRFTISDEDLNDYAKLCY